MLSRKLQANQLDALLSDLHDFSVCVPAQVQGDIIPQIDTAQSVLHKEPRQVREVAESIGDWLLEYFQCVVSSQPQSKLKRVACLRRRFVTLAELPLWDICYTGSTPFPAEV